jgi:hypothetical protein
MADGFQVQPSQLTGFAGFLRNTTEPVVQAAAQDLNAKATGFDNDAFGVILAQILALPARIALGAGADTLNNLKSELDNAASTTDTTAGNYQNTDQQNANSFTAVQGGR